LSLLLGVDSHAKPVNALSVKAGIIDRWGDDVLEPHWPLVRLAHAKPLVESQRAQDGVEFFSVYFEFHGGSFGSVAK